MAILCSKDSVQQVREALAVALAAMPPTSSPEHKRALWRLINDCDAMRPLDEAGKHAHCTKLCGCRPL